MRNPAGVKATELKPQTARSGKEHVRMVPSHDAPSTTHSLKTPDHGRTPTFQRKPVQTGRQDVSFTGRGFCPDYMTEQNLTMMPEASRTTLENEGVYGNLGMMPPAGRMGKLQAGQKLDEGSGGAGSFATIVAWGARSDS
jgi:hypothetical protein